MVRKKAKVKKAMKQITISKIYDCGALDGCLNIDCWGMVIVTGGCSSTYLMKKKSKYSNTFKLFTHLLKWG